MLNLSSGGSKGTSTLVPDGRRRYPASIDQIAALSRGNLMKRITQTKGHANNMK
jgi:hypothetical protein